ncbi:hypothetical protein I4U23_025930 [Adineta vaga]|nr:hypothetical protein I4U23_025930 [Adineta vaga]
MRFSKILILHFFFLCFCYCHDLNHIDPVNKHAETTNSYRNEEATEIHSHISQDFKQPSIKPSDVNYEQPIQFTTPSVDISLQTQVPVSVSNNFNTPSTPLHSQTKQQSTEAPVVVRQIKTDIPISNDKLNVKLVNNNFQSQQQEQIKPISDHIPTFTSTQQTIYTTTQNSLSNSPTPSISSKPTETSTIASTTTSTESHIPVTITTTTTATTTAARILRSATPKVHVHPRHIPDSTEDLTKKNVNQHETIVTKDLNDKDKYATTAPSTTTEKPHIETTTQQIPFSNDQIQKPVNNIDLPRQVRVHHTPKIMNQQDTLNVTPSTDDSNTNTNLTLNKDVDKTTTIGTTSSVPDINTHEPLIDEKLPMLSNETKIDNINNSSILKMNTTVNNTRNQDKNRQICWRLPKRFEPSIELLENQIFRFLNILPDFVQTVFFGRIEDREVLMNTMWFGSVCTLCALFSFLFLSMGTKRLKQSKTEKEVRARCQQLQQYNNQIDLERSTFERQNQKLTDEIEELKSVPVRDSDEDLFTLREECFRFQDDLKTVRAERDALQQNIDHKQNLIQKHEYEMQRQAEAVAYLNNEILQLKQDLEKERATISRYQSNDLSLERFEKSQELIHELKSEITQLKQDKFTQKDQLQEIQDHSNQLDIENNQLTLRMKQLKVLLEQRDQTIKRIQEKINEEEPKEFEDLLLLITENSSSSNQQLLSTVDNDLEKSNQHIRNLHHEIDEKTNRIKELDLLLKQEKDRAKEMETKLKVVLELRERDAHLHIRQLGQTDAELRKARNDTERVRILQQQLDLKQQQLDDVQKVLSTEQMKFNEECGKLQHETHEKWMEVKRLIRELDISKKECEALRKQITKYASSSQEKTMIKPVPQHYGNNGELETNGNSPNLYQQAENFRPIDHQRNESGATSPADMFMPRPPMFGLPRPPFYPTPFLPHPPPNAFMMHPRFPMPTTSPHGMISPLSHLMINSNDMNNSENVDSSNITPNSTSYERQSNEGVLSPVPENGKQVKTKKTKKSSKKKGETSLVKENV